MTARRAIIHGLCPRCRQGKIFLRGITMNPLCPVCHLTFEREPGYFLGAMYFSYGLSIPPMLTIFLFLRHFTHQTLSILALETMFVYIPLIPMIFRYSRILWIYWDRKVDPDS